MRQVATFKQTEPDDGTFWADFVKHRTAEVAAGSSAVAGLPDEGDVCTVDVLHMSLI